MTKKQAVEVPKGAVPKSVHNSIRQDELKKAIIRYLEVDLPVNPLWLEEYNELTRDWRKK